MGNFAHIPGDTWDFPGITWEIPGSVPVIFQVSPGI